ncbi:hypothetical protein ON010_g17 [Phytophthora cinnamomi]|nr:hypothetical protein ON010_g17 [Phytophthora cinnamomi]
MWRHIANHGVCDVAQLVGLGCRGRHRHRAAAARRARRRGGALVAAAASDAARGRRRRLRADAAVARTAAALRPAGAAGPVLGAPHRAARRGHAAQHAGRGGARRDVPGHVPRRQAERARGGAAALRHVASLPAERPRCAQKSARAAGQVRVAHGRQELAGSGAIPVRVRAHGPRCDS